MSGTVGCRLCDVEMSYIVFAQAQSSTITYIYIIVAELKMRWSVIIMSFIVTETAATPSIDLPVKGEKTLRRGE